MKEKITENMLDALYETIAMLDNKDDAKMFLTDLCSVDEVKKMAQRLTAAKLLRSGLTYQQVIAETDISSTTLSRISACLRRGAGGYKKYVK